MRIIGNMLTLQWYGGKEQKRYAVSKRCAFVTESGNTLNLKANTTHYVRRSDVETLIHQGLLEHL
jgi:hypothetical protein